MMGTELMTTLLEQDYEEEEKIRSMVEELKNV